ncbi:exodeoxyribonuclease V subunit alpha [Desulfoprunum benzoelyticum]|uniref:Exodeoxyribonuclease V alpha subunit n=1 Tax=Desulfoprunum benzoelyticum TaxID=1506996 RepID=A0A840V6F0_9BACT|nr:exodeoxyribonuclease V subunit alpha [Desulfoprunum benzoelyticum]MBB5349480.1 exodeoxyribonuclease V alpha subunit [Desulfoprunum benzoelyticum]MBM9531871.1 exodeoxyribonuclease V subunit alpha [Desulfoprunum benzoelyticum]
MNGPEYHDLFDRHLAAFLEGRCGLAAAERPLFRMLVADLSAAMAAGHVCLSVGSEKAALLSRSPLVSDGGVPAPLVLHAGYLYLHRYYRYERRLADQLLHLAQVRHQVPGLEALLDSCFPVEEAEHDRQRLAARLALTRSLTLITGGPGTGKTFTVARILALLLRVHGPGLRLALAAPTGKAAMRLRESIANGIATLDLPPALAAAVPAQAATLHRLLGVRADSSRFRHEAGNPLPADVVVVDEASMIDLALMSKLVDALGPTARLILLGDRDQLASVESGAVLADCSRSLPDNTVELDRTYRFDHGISQLATLINSQDGGGAWDLLDRNAADSVSLVRGDFVDQAVARYRDYMTAAVQAEDATEIQGLFTLLNRFRVLCAVHHGRQGTALVNAAIEDGLRDAGCSIPSDDPWYPGRPILVTRNDYSLDLFNGDVGICLPDRSRDGRSTVWFERPDGRLRSVLPSRLPQCETVFAMTVHKSQGSEFDEVLVVLPEHGSPVLSRELVYTAITRARTSVRISARREVLALAAGRSLDRFSGLAAMLDQAAAGAL